MTDQEIYAKIEETYNTEKGKNFVTHLLRSFMPISKASRMFNNDRNLRLRDCITGETLGTLNDYLNTLASEEGMQAFFENAKAQMKASLVEGQKTYEVPESVKNLRKKINPVAIVCEKSDKVISEQTLQQLFNFFASEILKGNKHINWLANNERGKEFVKYGKEKGYVNTKREERVVHKAVERAKLSLGDFAVLKDLKAKLEKDESK